MAMTLLEGFTRKTFFFAALSGIGLSCIAAGPAQRKFADDYEYYATGLALETANSRYNDKGNATIVEDGSDPVNSTQVVRIEKTDSDGGIVNGITTFNKVTAPLSGTVRASIDILPTQATGGRHGILFWNSQASASSGYAAWLRFYDGGQIIGRTDGASHVFAKTYDPTHWYRVEITMHLDAADGDASTYDATITDLTTDTVIGTANGLDPHGDPTHVDGGEFDALANTSKSPGTPAVLDGRYDNLSLTAPEPD